MESAQLMVIVWLLSPAFATFSIGHAVNALSKNCNNGQKKILTGWAMALLVLIWGAFILRWFFTEF